MLLGCEVEWHASAFWSLCCTLGAAAAAAAAATARCQLQGQLRAPSRPQVVDGLQMFVGQALYQFELFTGQPAPREKMEQTMLGP